MDFQGLRATRNMRLFLLRVATLCSCICFKAPVAHRAHRIMIFLETNAQKLIHKMNTRSEVTIYSKKTIIELYSLIIMLLVQNYLEASPTFSFSGILSWFLNCVWSLLEAGASLFCHVSSLATAPII